MEKTEYLLGVSPTFVPWRKKMLKFLVFLKSMDIKVKDLMNYDVFSSVPYQKENSKEFFRAC